MDITQPIRAVFLSIFYLAAPLFRRTEIISSLMTISLGITSLVSFPIQYFIAVFYIFYAML